MKTISISESLINYWKKIVICGTIIQTAWIPFLYSITGDITKLWADAVVSLLLWLCVFFIYNNKHKNLSKYNTIVFVAGIIMIFLEQYNYHTYIGNKYLYLTITLTTYLIVLYAQASKTKTYILAALICLLSLRIPDDNYFFFITCLSFSFAIVFSKNLLFFYVKETVQKNDQINLLEQEKSKENNMHAIAQISQKVSHEVNNQLSEITCSADVLELLIPEAAPEVKEIIKGIQKQAQKTSGMIKNLSKMSELKKMKLSQIACIDLNAKFDDLIKKYKTIRQDEVKDILIGFQAQYLQNFVNLSFIDIEYVVFNILDNAVFALKDSSIKEIELRLTQHDPEHLLMEISNTGKKIPYSIESLLFKEFTSSKDIAQGSGVSLFVSNMIANEHEATLELSSNIDGNVTFCLNFNCNSLSKLNENSPNKVA